MSKNQDDLHKVTINLLPVDRKHLFDEEAKVGQIHLTAQEQKQLLELTTYKGWNVLKHVFLRQRLVQIAVANMTSTAPEDLWFYKGKTAEADYMIKTVEKIAEALRKEEADKSRTKEERSRTAPKVPGGY